MALCRSARWVLCAHSMSIIHEQPRRTWPQHVPYSHLTGVDTEGGIVGPLRFSLREEGPPCFVGPLRFIVTRCCSPRSMPTLQPSDASAVRGFGLSKKSARSFDPPRYLYPLSHARAAAVRGGCRCPSYPLPHSSSREFFLVTCFSLLHEPNVHIHGVLELLVGAR